MSRARRARSRLLRAFWRSCCLSAMGRTRLGPYNAACREPVAVRARSMRPRAAATSGPRVLLASG